MTQLPPSSFDGDLGAEAAFRHAGFWPRLYQQWFGAAVRQEYLNGMTEQRAGNDRALALPDGRRVLVQEKLRLTDYRDILLEYWSVLEARVPGWIATDHSCDYLNYAILPLRRAYLIHWADLREAWRTYRHEWVRRARQKDRGYYDIRRDNVRRDGTHYTTVSVAIPLSVLRAVVPNIQDGEWDIADETVGEEKE